MEDLEFYENSLHHIDLSVDSIEPTEMSDEEDLNDYIESLIEGVSKPKSKRQFQFKRETTEVATAIKEILDGKRFVENTQTIATRLLEEEKKAQEGIERLGRDIKKGSLVQSFLEINGKDFFIITKVEHNSFIDRTDLQKHVGLPFKKKVLKSCLIESVDAEIQNVIVYDTQSPISVYWWRDFLGLKELNSDEKNTKTAFDAVDMHLNRTVKKKSPADHVFLRNALVGYFRTQAEFDFDEMIKYIIGVLQPENSAVDINKLKNQLEKLPEKKQFDRRFTIEAKQITARKMKRVIPLHESIDLNIKTAIKDLDKIITPVIGEDDKKYLRIRSDNGFDLFNRDKIIDESN